MAKRISYIPATKPFLVKNVGIYCRVSSNKKEQLNSLATQISALTSSVSKIEQWKLVDTFIDIASGKAGETRNEFDRMITACESKNISVIVTKSISRFGRDTVETMEAIQRIKAAGARIIFQEENLDTDEYDSSFIITILESLAQAENESRSANIRLGLSYRAATGTLKNFDKPIYGYLKNEAGKLIIDKEKAEVVRDIYYWYLKGESILGIVRKLEENEVLSPTGKPRWSKKTIENILSNKKYTGSVKFINSFPEGFEYQIDEHHPAIVTEYEFNAVQEEKRNRSNMVTDENGTHRKSTKYSSKKK